jgi:hypothetical protein
MLAVHGMRAEEQIVEGKGEELERLRAKPGEAGIDGLRAAKGDDGIQDGPPI